MRAALTVSLLFPLLLAACASAPDTLPVRRISQSGALKVHPGLLGGELPVAAQAPVPESFAAASEPAMKLDEVGLRTQRSVYFDLDSEVLKDDYKPALQAHGRYLAEHPQARVRIEGNADERGSSEYNARLARKRAENVRQSIVTSGAGERQVTIKSLGESRPKLKGHDEEAWAENRRADVVYEREE